MRAFARSLCTSIHRRREFVFFVVPSLKASASRTFHIYKPTSTSVVRIVAKMDSRAEFFARMDAEHQRQAEQYGNGADLDIDFSVTSSGRTTLRNAGAGDGLDDMDFSVLTSGRTLMNTDRSMGTIGTIGTIDSAVESLDSVSSSVFQKTIQDVSSNGLGTEAGTRPTTQDPNAINTAAQKSTGFQPLLPLPEHPSRQKSAPRAIPQPASMSVPNSQPMAAPPASQPSSAGSTASGFLNSLLDPAATTFNSTHISHTPPCHLVSSYEASHFGKRARSGSISERLRVSTELEQKGMIDREQKGILKDLIISGQDNELQHALDRYEQGDTALLETMLKDGSLSTKARDDIDLLGDLDLDFLNVTGPGIADLTSKNIEYNPANGQQAPGYNQYSENVGGEATDGIGELDFDGGMNDADNLGPLNSNFRSHSPMYNQQGQRSRSNSAFSVDLDFRQRSNSLFSALIGNVAPQEEAPVEYGRWMEHASNSQTAPHTTEGIFIDKPMRRSSAPEMPSNLSITMASEDKKLTPAERKNMRAEEKRRERLEKKEMKERQKREKKEKKELAKLERQKKVDIEDREEHEPGSGRPRSMSDPNIKTSIDANGLLQVERPDGWIGAYSPESRKVRIARFLEKRNHRVWTKTVKYDVRKNFADSRLRVKGRFVKKEDELLMRELMSLT